MRALLVFPLVAALAATSLVGACSVADVTGRKAEWSTDVPAQIGEVEVAQVVGIMSLLREMVEWGC